MPTILIFEADPSVAALLAFVARRSGHTPVDLRQTGSLRDFDAFLFEPADRGALGWARVLRSLEPDLPLVCVSIYPRLPEAIALEPVAYLLKPFALVDLEHALDRAVGRG